VSNDHEQGGTDLAQRPLPGKRGLLERDVELAAVKGLIADAAVSGRLLAIEGPPGIGKTALMSEAKALAQESGLEVLAARGSELERSFSYGVVRQLFEPLLASLRADERADLLEGVAALAAPLFDPAEVAAPTTAQSSVATLHGLYWLTANLTARRPLLLAVDDLAWCDLSSLRWLAYVLPRMEGLDLLIIVGLRPAEPGEDIGILGQILGDPLATVIRPDALSRDAAVRFVHDALSPDADDAFCAACHEETAGNPLLLRELVYAVAAAGLGPTEGNVPRLRELGAQALSRTISLRMSRLGPEATMLARAVAILGDDADPRLAGALAGLEEQAASEAVAALAAADVLRLHAPLGFVHPLVRAAVEETLTPVERDGGHARAARLLAGAGAEPERVAAHLLRCPPAGESQVVEILRDAARRASSRGASESAVAYLRRALAEAPAAAERAEVLLELGSAEGHVSGEAAIEHLQAAYALTSDPIKRAKIALQLSRQLFLLHGEEESDAVLSAALDELAGADAELGRLLEAGLISNGLSAPALYRAVQERLERVRRANADKTFGEKLLLSLLASHDAHAGAPADATVALARRALAEGTLISEDVSGTAFVAPCTVLAMADLNEALVIFDDAFVEAHRRGSPLGFAAAKAFSAQTLVWRGELAEAEAEAGEALAIGSEWGASARFTGHAAAFLADALMEQGKLDDAAALLARAEQGEALAGSARLLYFANSSARLRLLRGDLAGGVAELLDGGRRYEAVGIRNPAFIAWRSPAALALQQLGELGQARRLATEELALARTWGAPRALGMAMRAAGLIEGGKRGLALLNEAVQVLEESPAKLEHAKARAELGAALRRAKRRAEAREHLRKALELATICGAAALAERAESELLATGARPRRIALSGVQSLTPSERRVAEMAAKGPTNREIAQALFVTQRTVEVHLTSIYRKLGISSRSQLASALSKPAST
jgi:DNA-binding CsgD family transcriptional regulator/tetratricopeptide (TPR) repeat protein